MSNKKREGTAARRTKAPVCDARLLRFVCLHFSKYTACEIYFTGAICSPPLILCLSFPLRSLGLYSTLLRPLCLSSVSVGRLYCSLFALASQSPAGKQRLVSLGSGTEQLYSFTMRSCYPIVWIGMWCEKWGGGGVRVQACVD